ncbi:MAG TPA: carbon starvation protein A [Phycisphaerae bacterium]|nr:carbon starvation protein A [Phycisphaerae bacterium]
MLAVAILNNSLTIALLAGVGYIVAYRLYGRYISRRILGLDPARRTPAHERQDGVDFVPTHPAILFGHHFASIAGLGPIVGPAIAVFWGWLPAVLWCVFGSIFIGAVHDLSTLYISLRHQGRTIGDLTNDIIGARARVLFLIIIFFLLALAMGVFALLMAKLFVNLSPQAVTPTFSLILIAVVIGLLVYKLRWRLGRVTLIGLGLMFIVLAIGLEVPVSLYKAYVGDEVKRFIATTDDPEFPRVHGIAATRAAPTAQYFEDRAEQHPEYAGYADQVHRAEDSARKTWTYTLLVYAFVASVLPVWLLLQPRDYINSYQLYIGLAVLMLGLIVWRPAIVVDPIRSGEAIAGADPIWPFLFITIACGAVSGFHNLVSSGTTVRQIRSERDAPVIAYGAMLTEGFLAVLVVLACVAGLGREGFDSFYSNWQTASTSGLGAFLQGAGLVISRPFVWLAGPLGTTEDGVIIFCQSFIAVVVVSFAMTTLDSGTRLLRFNVENIGKVAHLPPLRNRYFASLIAVVAIGFFALLKLGGKPVGMALWQLFGTTNQLLAAIGLLVVSVYLFSKRKPIIYTLLPMIGMLFMVLWAMCRKLTAFYDGWQAEGDWGHASLFFVGLVLMLLTIWLVFEAAAFARWHRVRKQDQFIAAPGT